jgi:hypothetical protein
MDYHKRYSALCTVDAEARRVQSTRVAQNEPAAFAPAPSRTVLEACCNRGWRHDLLGKIPGVAGVVLAHLGKTQIKINRLDAEKLATLLRGNLAAVSRMHAWCLQSRRSKPIVSLFEFTRRREPH